MNEWVNRHHFVLPRIQVWCSLPRRWNPGTLLSVSSSPHSSGADLIAEGERGSLVDQAEQQPSQS